MTQKQQRQLQVTQKTRTSAATVAARTVTRRRRRGMETGSSLGMYLLSCFMN